MEYGWVLGAVCWMGLRLDTLYCCFDVSKTFTSPVNGRSKPCRLNALSMGEGAEALANAPAVHG